MDKKYIDKLNKKEKAIIVDAQTEAPFSGEYNNFYLEGDYVCKACNLQLFESNTKFNSNCGWPSFDEAIKGRVTMRRDDSLGRIRTEIICSKCEGHLGHVFEGEEFTIKNTRYCVNSLSLKFIPK
jgi:methionine-R-sulfoxide reductase